MDKLKKLTVVIPALNEAHTISKIVTDLMRIADTVIVVDDGSQDSTGELAKKAGATIIRHEFPLGYDHSIADGLNLAFTSGARAVVTCDADGQHQVSDVYKISSAVVLNGCDFAAGIRDSYNRPIEKICGGVSQLIFQNEDPFCGLKCYGRSMYENFGPFPAKLNIQTLPFIWIKRKKLKAEYLPIEVRRRIDQPRFANQLRGNIKLAEAFLRTLKLLL